MDDDTTAGDVSILGILDELSDQWQSFAQDPMPSERRGILQQLILLGFAQTRVCYRVVHLAERIGYKLTYDVSGPFLQTVTDGRTVDLPLMRFLSYSCPRGWFSSDGLDPVDGVMIETERNEWQMCLTDLAARWCVRRSLDDLTR